MPLYEYKCQDCGETIDFVRPVAERNEPVCHGACGGEAKRVWQVPGISIEGRAFVYRGDPNRMFD